MKNNTILLNTNKYLKHFFFLTVFFIHFSAVPGAWSSFSSIFLLAFLGTYLWRGLRYKKWGFEKSGLEWLFLFYFLASFISIFDAYIISWSVGKTISLALAILLFYIFASALQNRTDLNKYMNVIFWGGFVFLMAGVMQFIAYYVLELWHWKIPLISFLSNQARGMPRISSLFLLRSGTNVYSCYLALFGPFLMSYVHQQKYSLWFKALITVLLIFNIVFSYSRALYVSLIFALILSLIVYYKKTIKLIVPVLLVGLILYFIPPINSTIGSIFNKRDNSNIEHLQTMGSALNLISKHPINGWGADHVSRKIRQTPQGWVDGHGYKMELKAKNWTPTKFYELREQAKLAGVISIDSPHNIYFWNFIDTGIIGFTAFIFLLGIIYYKLFKLIFFKHKDFFLYFGLWWGFTMFLGYSFFQDSLNAPIMTSFFWLFVLLVCGLEKYNKQKVLN